MTPTETVSDYKNKEAIMREIKFRAWHIKTSKIIDLHKITPLAIAGNLSDNTDGLYIPFSPEVILMQYTGLKDKNGKDIYEGDILTNTIYQRRFICPKNKNRGYYRNQKVVTKRAVEWNEWWGSWDTHKYSERGELEVIGNIYENKELL